MNRREHLKILGLGTVLAATNQACIITNTNNSANTNSKFSGPVILSTWYNQSVTANNAAWSALEQNGQAIDAVESGVMVIEDDWSNCCVGLGGNPDRDGKVTLDAAIMNHNHECGSVAFLEQIKHPISVARAVMENTQHVMLVGEGAQQFAVSEGFSLEKEELSDHAEKAYKDWLDKNDYNPINVEQNQSPQPSDEFNHDTIGLIAIDENGDLSGACTTSGMGFKMRGRVGDSPIIGAGLYVDNEVGAATATGHGEEVIRIAGSFLVVEFMRNGDSPEIACKKAVQRIQRLTPRDEKDIQVGFIAINKQGEYGGYALQSGFDFGVKSKLDDNKKVIAKSLI